MPEGAIFMGASAGGIEAVEEVISQFPASLPAPVFVVVHIPQFAGNRRPHQGTNILR
jgi:chemotaxis response regulator CheB